MNIFTGIVVYLMIFWTILFAILPWGNQAPERPEGGAMGGAPANPRIKQKFLITFLVSTLIWAIIAGLIYMEVIDFYEISRQMVAEDIAKDEAR